MNPWLYNNVPLLEVPLDAKAFIYKITYLPTGQYYIGYKLFNSKSTKKLGKRAIAAMTDKRKSKKVTVVKESTWKEYVGSCKDAEYKDLWKKHPEGFKREILYVVGKNDWSEKYYEKKYMILHNWEHKLCFNGNFEGKIFKSKDRHR